MKQAIQRRPYSLNGQRRLAGVLILHYFVTEMGLPVIHAFPEKNLIPIKFFENQGPKKQEISMSAVLISVHPMKALITLLLKHSKILLMLRLIIFFLVLEHRRTMVVSELKFTLLISPKEKQILEKF
jgi:hypothetical protein